MALERFVDCLPDQGSHGDSPVGRYPAKPAPRLDVEGDGGAIHAIMLSHMMAAPVAGGTTPSVHRRTRRGLIERLCRKARHEVPERTA